MMKQRTGGRDEEVVATVVLAVIVLCIVVGGAFYTQAQLDAAEEIAMTVDVPQPQAMAEYREPKQRDASVPGVWTEGERVTPADRAAIR